MLELLNNAWSGWLYYTEHGKFAALLLVVLLFLWFRREEVGRELLVYSTIAAGCCIFPVTAMLLQKYQTLFYDYVWIWQYVPLTMLLAYGITVFLAEQWKNYKKEAMKKGETVTRKNKWQCIGVTVAVAAVVLLCGSLGKPVFSAKEAQAEREHAYTVLEALAECAGDEEIFLWAPEEIMSYARAYDGNIRLIYGRNMWEKALMGHSYDTYGDVEESMYQWMKSVEADGNQEAEIFLTGGVSCMEAAWDYGVNCILLPGNVSAENISGLEQTFGLKAELLEGYYLFR